jgi:hypothetical protein
LSLSLNKTINNWKSNLPLFLSSLLAKPNRQIGTGNQIGLQNVGIKIRLDHLSSLLAWWVGDMGYKTKPSSLLNSIFMLMVNSTHGLVEVRFWWWGWCGSERVLNAQASQASSTPLKLKNGENEQASRERERGREKEGKKIIKHKNKSKTKKHIETSNKT